MAINQQQQPISIAPMMDWTDRHYRYFMRLITKRTLLYTEMITSAAIVFGDRQKLLAYHPQEHPIAMQIGGSDPKQLAESVKIVTDFSYDQINLNVGCPSDRVQSGRFGACLMAEPELVAECVHAMQAATHCPVTVKTRIGIDDLDAYQDLVNFISIVSQTGCDTFILHARKAWLNGLSPKQNREIPPLKYDVVHAIKRDFPHLTIIINGGIKTLPDIDQQLPYVDGVMLGREAYHNPFIFADVDQRYYGASYPVVTRSEVIQQFIPYLLSQIEQGIKPSSITRHILGLFKGVAGGKQWRRRLSENINQKDVTSLMSLVLHL